MALRKCIILSNFFFTSKPVKRLQTCSCSTRAPLKPNQNWIKLIDFSRPFFEINWGAIFGCWNLKIFRTLSVRTLAGSEQLGRMKKRADGGVQNLMPKHYQIAKNQKEKKLKMFQKKTNCLNCKFLLLIDQLLKWPQLQPNGTKLTQWLFPWSKDLLTQTCSTDTQILSGPANSHQQTSNIILQPCVGFCFVLCAVLGDYLGKICIFEKLDRTNIPMTMVVISP